MGTDLARLVEASVDSGRPAGDHLEVMGGPEDGRTFPLGEAMVTVGRLEDNTIALGLDPTISRRHAAIEHGPHGYTIRDAGSTHGTIADGVRVTAPARLANGSLIVLGQTTLCVRLERSGESR